MRRPIGAFPRTRIRQSPFQAGGRIVLGPHVGTLELMAIVLMALATGVAWLIGNWCRRRGGRG